MRIKGQVVWRWYPNTPLYTVLWEWGLPQTHMHIMNTQTLSFSGGLYCPPLIPAGIWQNPGNSWNSRGIKFGTGAGQIDQMILAEFRMEFKFCENGSRNHPEGMLLEWDGMELLTPKLSISVCWCLIWVSLINNPTLSRLPPSTNITNGHHYAHLPSTTHNTYV